MFGHQPSHGYDAQVHAYLYSKRWETRTAAADTLGALADAFPHHTPVDILTAAGSAAIEPGIGEPWQVSLLFAGVDLQRMLEQGQPLLASGGQVRQIIVVLEH